MLVQLEVICWGSASLVRTVSKPKIVLENPGINDSAAMLASWGSCFPLVGTFRHHCGRRPKDYERIRKTFSEASFCSRGI